MEGKQENPVPCELGLCHVKKKKGVGSHLKLRIVTSPSRSVTAYLLPVSDNGKRRPG